MRLEAYGDTCVVASYSRVNRNWLETFLNGVMALVSFASGDFAFSNTAIELNGIYARVWTELLEREYN